MQKKTKAKTLGAVYTSYLYEISVQSKERDELKDRKIINIDESRTHQKKVGF